MHILIAVLHRPTKPTGVCRYAANLARCLSNTEQITQITIVTGTWQRSYFKDAFLLSDEKIKIVDVDIENRSIARNIWFLFGLPKLVRRLAPDLVHLAFPLPFWRSLFPCPVAATIHDLYPYQFPENFGRWQALFNRLFLQICIHNSDALACVSQITLNYLNHYFPEIINQGKKASVIYNFVDFDQVQARLPTALQNDYNYPFILCVGQHRKNKNLDLLIQAYVFLIGEGLLDEATKLIIVGSPGPETDNLTQLVQETSLEKMVLMLSAIDDDELCWLYQHSKLFVIPSSLEGFCIPLVEALYFSCKVICSDIPIFREVGSSSCTYFDLTGDPVKNLAQSIRQTLESNSLSRTDVNLKFSKTAIADQCLRFYAELI